MGKRGACLVTFEGTRPPRMIRYWSVLTKVSSYEACSLTLSELRASARTAPTARKDNVRTLGDVTLPDRINLVLARGPKFAVEPDRTAPELLSLVLRVSGLAPDAEADRCVSEGVDVLFKCRKKKCDVPVRQTESFLRTNALSLLPSDKEGGFIVLKESLCKEKAEQAILSAFTFKK
ncbi:hypothetical protein HPB48_022798 [Haemaphysalis longicornis]|uniref:Uncharacterized protein n=1 Tax=Haemaphysalis longicornis TaxID=44386 RepID=A0A9J6FAY8_HAELO|nr:hypothetical protein HPB48_022798 [Haemaphysalis longicornis]